MASCYGCHDTSVGRTDAPENFWRGLALGLFIWLVLVGALVIA